MGLLDGIMGNAGRIDPAAAQQEYGKLFGQGETVYAAYILVRDAILFTNRRLILIDKQGVTGRKTSYHSIPYRAITQFTVETAGTFDLDAELVVWISGSNEPVQKRFNRQVDIYEVQGILSHFVAV
ncbi:PH domain-containing protein [Nocardia uniformis]|uniref:PH domain-containing protein n=1 Tax=Nocardia uniformis TaxID=53432 RepID=A0A849CFQ1_9NOCA|nr:PH domain-containing protein [Nocardia uniformis]NNH75585.1 PH domain-containing protein [Nocardia uniformis]